MKSISNAMKSHLAGGVTTLAAGWLITRTDGRQFAYTTLDDDRTIDGVTYHSTLGFSRSAITSGSTGEVDNLEVLGYFSDDGITQQDLINGLFDYASVFLFLYNFADLSMGIIKLRRGWLGECARNPDGSFHAELRGLTYALTQEFSNVLTPYCRADLGDAKCKVPIAPAAWLPNTAYAAGTWVSPASKGTDDLLLAIFQSAGGTSGATEPAWDTTIASTTTDNDITWTAGKPIRLLATVAAPIDRHSFISAPLVLGGNDVGTTATIGIRNNVKANTALEISDGTNGPISVFFEFDTSGAAAATTVENAITAAEGSTGIRITSIAGTTNINIKNITASQGNITVTNDTAVPTAFLITQFTEGWLDYGTLTWLSGDNAGTTMEIKSYVASGSKIITWLGLNYAPAIGDRFLYAPGCDKSRRTCQDKFSNVLNFRGEPDMPGLDKALAYPEVL